MPVYEERVIQELESRGGGDLERLLPRTIKDASSALVYRKFSRKHRDG